MFFRNGVALLPYVTTLLLHTETPFACVPPQADFPASIVFSGTRTLRDLVLDDLDVTPARWPDRKHGGIVHGGFARRTRHLLDRMDEFITSNDNLLITGHSLGGACAVLAASYLRYNRSKNICAVYTFGMPSIATKRFRRFYETQHIATQHFATPRDPIVHRLPTPYRELGNVFTLLECDEEQAWAHHDMRAYHAAIHGSPMQPWSLDGGGKPLKSRRFAKK